MTYTVLTRNGFLHVFSVKALAETYVQAYGGVVFTQQVLVDTTAQTAV